MRDKLKLLDSEFSYIPTDKGLNIILCDKLNETFLGVFEITIDGKKVLGEQIDTIKGDPVVKIPTTINDRVHDLLFIVQETTSSAGVILNLKTLYEGRDVLRDEKAIVESIVEEVDILPNIQLLDEQISPKTKFDIERYKKDAIDVIARNFDEKKAEIENLQSFLTNKIKLDIDQIKESTFFDVEKIKAEVADTLQGIFEYSKEETSTIIAEAEKIKTDVTSTVDTHLQQLDETSAKILAELKVAHSLEIKNLNESVDEGLKTISESKDSILKLIDDQTDIITNLSERVLDDFKTLYDENVTTLANISESQEKRLSENISSILSQIEETKQQVIGVLHDEVSNVVNTRNQISESVKIKIDTDIASLKKQLEEKIKLEGINLKKYVAGYGGGGSVAVQYANGGTMNGTLNIASGQILSGGVDLADIFTGGGGSGYQTLSFNENNASLTISPNGNTISLSALSGGGGGSATGAYLPLSGGTLTGDLEIQAAITAVDSIQFTLTSGVTTVPGQLAWNAEESTLNLGVNSDVTLQIGQEQLIQVKNTSGQVIYNGAPVFASGASGGGSGNITVSAYRAGANDADELYFLGVATQELADNGFGFITTFGKVRGVVVSQVQATDDVGPLSAWAIGTILYPSATQAGRFTSTPPVAPNKDLPVAMVISVNGNQRSFFIRAEHGYHLDELHDVARVTPSDGNVLTFSSLSGVWYPKAPETNYLPLSGGTVTGTTVFTGTLSATLIEAISANFTVIDIKQYELSGFNVDGNVTVSGTISSNNIVYATGGNSNNWNSTYTTLNANSGSWDSVYSTVNSNSATQWNYQGSDIKALTANWQDTYTNFSAQSASNASVYSTVNSKSGSWDSVYSSFNAQSAANASVYSTVNSNSATQWNYQGSDIKALTANWENTYSTVNTTSASWLQTLAFDEVTSILSISNSNSVSLSALNESSVFSNYLPLSGGTLTGPVSTNQDIEITDSTKGIILRSPSNFKYRITVTDAGELVTTAI